ncbi:expressed protein [Echinococcus multilocularis]|uniref:Expressed protein n=1 Tax=Echinococcus multilocularis TaxID=6211 RepID=A0A068Y6G5_ECHMU|nr:expressed protein [Echinococcus multilocularis]
MLPGHISLPGSYPESRKVEEMWGLSLIGILIQGRNRHSLAKHTGGQFIKRRQRGFDRKIGKPSQTHP